MFKSYERVYYADTDAYGVVWHGTYLRWLEIGRTLFCDSVGCSLDVLAKEHDIVFPVVNINISYKNSAKLYDEVVVETEIKELTKLYVVFHQTIKHKQTEKVLVEADVKVVAINTKGVLYRRFPEVVYNIFSNLNQ